MPTPKIKTRVSLTMPQSNQLKSPKQTLKRPLPADDDDNTEESSDEAVAVTSEATKGKPRPKRLLTTDNNEGDSEGSVESEDEEEESEDDENEESEDDVEESESEADEDINEIKTVNASPKKLASVSEFKGTNAVKSPTKDTGDVACAMYMLSNLPPGTHTDELRRVLHKQVSHVKDVRVTTAPMAFIQLSKEVIMDPKGFPYKGRTVYPLRLTGGQEGLSAATQPNQGEVTKCILLTYLPKDKNESDIRGLLPKDCRLESIRLLTSGPKNKYKNAAFLNFTDTDSSALAMSKITTVSFNNQPLRAFYKKERDSASDYSHPKKTILATNLPPNITEDKLKKLFPEMQHCNIVPGGKKCYIDFATVAQCDSAFGAKSKAKIDNVQLNLQIVPTRTNDANTLTVVNIPFSATADDVKKLFPDAVTATLLKPGTCALQFSSADDVRLALPSANTKVMDGRQLRAFAGSGSQTSLLVRNVPFKATEAEVMRLYPGAVRVTLPQNPNGQKKGSAIVFFATSGERDAAAEMTKNKQLHGRQLFTNIGTENEHVPTAPVAKPKTKAGISHDQPAKKAKLDTSETSKLKKAAVKKPTQVGSSSEEDDDEEEVDVNEEDSEEEDDDEDAEMESADDDEDEDDVGGDSEQDDDESASGEDDDDDDEEDSTHIPIKHKSAQPQKANARSPAQNHRGGDLQRGRGSFKRGGDFQQRGRGGNFQQRGRGGNFQQRGRGSPGGGRARGQRGGQGFKFGHRGHRGH